MPIQAGAGVMLGTAALVVTAAIGLFAGCADPDINCGRLGEGWEAPEGCACRGPSGETHFLDEDGHQQAIRCEDDRLWACPSSSGYGCGLLGVPEAPITEGDPAVIETHVDIGGHLHDLCCAAQYNAPTGEGFSFECNGCIGHDPAGVSVCDNTTAVGSGIGIPQSRSFPCAAEWSYAIAANPSVSDVTWLTPFDTSLRWTGPQVIARNLAGAGLHYSLPAGGDVAPRYGRALAPHAFDDVDHRAPSGQRLGLLLLSLPYDAVTGGLGLLPIQIGSFCASGEAFLDEAAGGWFCR